MKFYISWCSVALVLAIISLISKLVEKHSLMSNNFEKIWFYYSIPSGKYKLKKTKKWKELLLTIWTIILSVFLSRITVIILICSRIKGLIEKSRLPDKMKEINFKIKHTNLDKDEILSRWNKGNEYLWYDERSYYYKEDEEVAEYKDGVLIWYDLDLWYGARVETVHISPKINRIFWLEWSFAWNRGKVFEYKITWTKLLVKCMQYDIGRWKNKEYAIKNWKINETNLKTWYASWDNEQTEEEYIKWFQELCEWHILKNIRVTTFVLATEQDIKRESEKMDKKEFNSLIDSKINDLENSEKEINNALKKYKLLKNVKDWNKLNKAQQKEQEKYIEELNKIEEKYWCSHFEYSDKKKIIEEINWYKY